MITAPVLSEAIRPTTRISDLRPKLDIERLIPRQFGDWSIDDTAPLALTISPEQAATLSQIYNQTLARNYQGKNGERVMLSVAYGGDQSDAMQIHRPEVCYPAQGFVVVTQSDATLDTGFNVIPIRRITAVQGLRIEPVTYWITVGDSVAVNKLRRKLAQLKISLTGGIPDGILFRVSTIGNDESQSYEVQERFIKSLLSALSEDDRKRLIGKSN
jgi:EpsI family protein